MQNKCPVLHAFLVTVVVPDFPFLLYFDVFFFTVELALVLNMLEVYTTEIMKPTLNQFII
jgi:hypothetical protein